MCAGHAVSTTYYNPKIKPWSVKENPLVCLQDILRHHIKSGLDHSAEALPALV